MLQKEKIRCFFARQNEKGTKYLCHMVGVTSQNDALERMNHVNWQKKCAGINEVFAA